VKEKFSLDMGLAVPVLHGECEEPFGSVDTGVGFGDLYLTFCGKARDGRLIVPFERMEYRVDLKALGQWTVYEPGDFPSRAITGEA
jgi:hypothetical protein